jgi:hypothetical protein
VHWDKITRCMIMTALNFPGLDISVCRLYSDISVSIYILSEEKNPDWHMIMEFNLWVGHPVPPGSFMVPSHSYKPR